PVAGATYGSSGVGELNAARAGTYAGTPPNPNRALNGFLKLDSSGSLGFDAASWSVTVKSNASWGDASWGDASWGDASWSAASWGDVSWNEASWADASWGDASWADASWGDASWADNADGDGALSLPSAPPGGDIAP